MFPPISPPMTWYAKYDVKQIVPYFGRTKRKGSVAHPLGVYTNTNFSKESNTTNQQPVSSVELRWVCHLPIGSVITSDAKSSSACVQHQSDNTTSDVSVLDRYAESQQTGQVDVRVEFAVLMSVWVDVAEMAIIVNNAITAGLATPGEGLRVPGGVFEMATAAALHGMHSEACNAFFVFSFFFVSNVYHEMDCRTAWLGVHPYSRSYQGALFTRGLSSQLFFTSFFSFP